MLGLFFVLYACQALSDWSGLDLLTLFPEPVTILLDQACDGMKVFNVGGKEKHNLKTNL